MEELDSELFDMLDERLKEMEEKPEECISVKEAIYFAIHGVDLQKPKQSGNCLTNADNNLTTLKANERIT